jgi:hypothetical protein
VVLDYGINYQNKAKIVGDVEYASVQAVAGAITPMPGGTGPLTIIALLENVLKVARLQLSKEPGQGAKPGITPDKPFNFRNENSAEPEGRAGFSVSPTDLAVNTISAVHNGFDR